MSNTRVLIEGWPALLPSRTAATYLSVDSDAFNELVAKHGIQPVEPAPGEVRWKRGDLDKIVSRLPVVPTPPCGWRRLIVELNDETISRIAAAISRRADDEAGHAHEEFMSVRRTAAHLSVAISSVYRMMGDGRLESVLAGGRRLIRRRSIDALTIEH